MRHRSAKQLIGVLMLNGRAHLLYSVIDPIATRNAIIGRRAARRTGRTLQPTLLVDEAFLRLAGQQGAHWQNRTQFFAVAAQTIRRLLVDHARSRQRQKRDFGLRVTLDESIAEAPQRSLDLLAPDSALAQLEDLSPHQARVVELRFFGGLDIEETAVALGISAATVKRD